MSVAYSPGLDSSYIWSLTNQLGIAQEASDQMTATLLGFQGSNDNDEELLVEKPEPFSKDSEPIAAVTESFLSDFGDIYWPTIGSSRDQKFRWSSDKEKQVSRSWLSERVINIFPGSLTWSAPYF